METGKLREFLAKQIEATNGLIKVLEGLRDSQEVAKFDRKVVNKRIKECISKTGRELNATYAIFKQYEYGTGITYTLEIEGSASSYYDYMYSIDNSIKLYNITLIDDKRFDLDLFRTKLQSSIEHLSKEVNQLESELHNIDSIVSEYTAIKNSIKQFNDKYSIAIRQGMKL